ncbi:hypothetical protein D6D02_04510 [Aureobasidium pullulans]|nr:hypothetical protein D6D02_04510 [Aureobasidium pullulans]
MSFGWSISDVILLAQYSWKVYESFAEGTSNASNEYDRFKREYRQVITCLERLVNTSPDISSLAGFDETFGDTIRFIDKHRVLTGKTSIPLISNSPQASNRIKTYLERLDHGYHTATWPMYRQEAEKLRQQLDRVVSIATLHATTTTLKNTQGIGKQSEDIMRAVKGLSDKVNFLLKRIAPTSIADTFELDLDYLATLSHTSASPPSFPSHLLAHSDRSESSDDKLELLHQFSQKMEYLIMRDSRGVRSMPGHHTTSSQESGAIDGVRPVLQLLDTARSVANTVLDDVGFRSIPQTQDPAQGSSVTVDLGARVDDWDVFGQWLKWHVQHDNTSESQRPIHSLPSSPIASSSTSPYHSPESLRLLVAQHRDISPSIVGSPLPEPIFTPDSGAFSTPGTVFTSNSSQRRFGSIDLGILENKRTFEGFLELIISPTSSVERLRTKTRDGKLTIYHLPQGDMTNAFTPWIDNSRVQKSSTTVARLQFKGTHQIIVKDERAHRNTVYHVRPIYCFDDIEDLRKVQEQLLGKIVLATFDVVRISTRAGQDHCASETLRVLEDEDRQRSLLYYAHKMSSKSATTNPGFVEWTLNDFEEIKKVDKKKMRLTFQRRNSLPRRSTIGSIDSVLSYDSASSGDPHTSIMQRIKALDCEFYDQEDREAFEELCKPASAPVFRMPFRPRDLGIGSPIADLDIGPPLAELEG